MKLTHEDVCEILDILDGTGFNELQLQTGDLKLALRRSGTGEWTQSSQSLRHPNLQHVSEPAAAAAPAAVEDTRGMVAVRTPLLGTFYRAPGPGNAPFVEVGDRVERDTVIGIVETMKLMNSVYAGANGRIVEICREDAEFVEQGSVLMLIDPDGQA
ncbi:MAG: acetyl-CoA carboxylase biotin carboxyl carrier protein subunit [Gammaproteobacteria bacterium]|nr:acetyl-CoA carboxylase biotin carboxyl carrier protein subunit [Gammaproteobacteria bacterium]